MTLPLTDLPVEECVSQLSSALFNARRAVLVAPPGSGKTTLAPLRLLETSWLLPNERIVMLEPRKLAARAAARRMAHMLGEKVGDTVGYQTRDERVIGPNTRIEVLTEGVLTRRLQSDPDLPNVGIVIFDEVHERNLPGDLGLALLLHAQESLGSQQRILLMSATPDTDRWCNYLGSASGEPAPVISSTGTLFPVEVHWWRSPTVRKGQRRDDERLENKVATTIVRALRETEGDILVFLPGIGEIRRAITAAESVTEGAVDLFPLAGALSLEEQDAALAPSRPGRRRIVFSTDIAESSLTVDGVRVVIDSGIARAPRFDPRTGMTRLTTVNISQASAHQRAGRSGRLGNGTAYRLWPQAEHGSRRSQVEPEILQVDLAQVALELAAWGVDVQELAFLDTPPSAAFEKGRTLLTLIGALNSEGSITELGKKMLSLPLHPRLGAMVMSASVKELWTACLLACLLEERDIVRGIRDNVPEDLAWRIECVDGASSDDRIDRHASARVRDQARDLLSRANRVHGSHGSSESVVVHETGKLLLRAYPDWLAVRKTAGGQFQLRSGAAAWMPKNAHLADEQFLVAADLDGDRKNSRIRLAAALSQEDITDQLAEFMTVSNELVWDREKNDLVRHIEWKLDGMRLRTVRQKPEPSEQTTAALIERIQATSLQALTWNDNAISLRQRVAFLHSRNNEWPDWSNKNLLSNLGEWLEPYLAGCTSRNDLEALNVALILRSGLPMHLGSELDALAPERVTLNNGAEFTIAYRGDEPPRISARVQAFYGVTIHPCIGAGAVPLVVELLSPAHRPVQVTSDLPAFWAGSWAEVRKEMAGRYPKHSWPANPNVRE